MYLYSEIEVEAAVAVAAWALYRVIWTVTHDRAHHARREAESERDSQIASSSLELFGASEGRQT